MTDTFDTTKYSGLDKYSETTQTKEPGLFNSCFITGIARDMQEAGKLQIMTDFDNNKYLVNNGLNVNFIPFFITRFREKTIKNAQGFVSAECFSWSGENGAIATSGRACPSSNERNNGYCDTCKFTYLIAGIYLDDKFQMVKVPKNIAKPEAGEIPALIYFKCQGVKFGAAMDFTSLLAKKAADLKPISDNPEFEKRVIAPKRFVCSCGVGQTDTRFGTKFTFQFDTVKALPEDQVRTILDKANDLVPEFERQFDKSQWLTAKDSTSSSAGEGSENSVMDADTSTVSFEEKPAAGEDPAPTDDSPTIEMPADDINFGL